MENRIDRTLALGIPPKQKHAHIDYVGEVRNLTAMADYYAAADVMVFCSKADNYPNTILESIAAGTPVIAYNVGGVKSQLQDPFSVVCEAGDIRALRSKLIEKISAGRKTPAVEETLKSKAVQRWAPKNIASKYMQLYSRLASLQ